MSESESVKCRRCRLTWSRRMMGRIIYAGKWVLLCRDCREEILREAA